MRSHEANVLVGKGGNRDTRGKGGEGHRAAHFRRIRRVVDSKIPGRCSKRIADMCADEWRSCWLYAK